MPSSDHSSPAVAANPSSYEFSVGNATQDAAAAVRLWADGGLSPGGTQADYARYEWFYLRNPQGLAWSNWLRHGSETDPVGFLGIGCRQMFLDGKALAAGVLVDFVVVPQHRSAFPALMLQRKGREQALASLQVVYGLPDTKAVLVCKRLESHVKFDLPRYVRVVRSRVYLERLLPQWVAKPLALFTDTLDWIGMRLQLALASGVGHWVKGFDASFDQLWAAHPKDDLCVGVRDRAFLQWRFADQPGRDYRTFVVRCKGALRAYFVCEITGTTLRVKDCLAIGSERELSSDLLMLALAARSSGLSSVEIQIASTVSVTRALRRAQYVVRSRRPFFAVVAESMRSRASSVGWHITQADEDV